MMQREGGFERGEENDADFHSWMKIDLVQALIGYDINITHLDAHIVNINNLTSGIDSEENSEITVPPSVKTIKGERMPTVDTFPTEFASFFVHFEVVFPETLTQEQQQAIHRYNEGCGKLRTMKMPTAN